jgi:hypothetical protein
MADLIDPPRYERDTGECPACHGIMAAMERCDVCHGTGHNQQKNIIAFPAPPTVRMPRAGPHRCECVRTGQRLWGGEASPCPVCGGDGLYTLERAREVYTLLLRHARDLPPLSPSHGVTQPVGMTLALALRQSPYGAYAVVGPHGKFRVYLEPAQAPDRFHAYAQDAVQPVGRESRFLIMRGTTIEAAYKEWPMLPKHDATVWWPLPKEAAFQLREGDAR